MASDAKKQAILTAISQIEKAYGKGSIMKMGESVGRFEVDTISTGSIPVDLALGVGGLPRGKPPTPSARSTGMEPVEIVSTSNLPGDSPIFMMEPLP